MGTQERAHSPTPLDEAALVRWMVGRDLRERFHRPRAQTGTVALEARGLRNEHVRDVSFSLHRGEVLGIAGLVGSGRSELVRALFGIDRLQEGEILVAGRVAKIRSPADALAAGIVLVPEDRKLEGLVMGHSVAFNAALPWAREWIRAGQVDRARRRAIVKSALERFAVKAADPQAAIGTLSGGNQQKVLVGRWLEKAPQALILDEPTRGVDVGAREDLYRKIGDLVEGGMAVLIVSSDLAELLAISHRVAIYREGRILEIVPADSIGKEHLLAKLTGAAA